MPAKQTDDCDHCKGEKTGKGDSVMRQDCGHVICDGCFDAAMGRIREVLYVGDIRCPVCDERA